MLSKLESLLRPDALKHAGFRDHIDQGRLLISRLNGPIGCDHTRVALHRIPVDATDAVANLWDAYLHLFARVNRMRRDNISLPSTISLDMDSAEVHLYYRCAEWLSPEQLYQLDERIRVSLVTALKLNAGGVYKEGRPESKWSDLN